jgi:hypothetical protein
MGVSSEAFTSLTDRGGNGCRGDAPLKEPPIASSPRYPGTEDKTPILSPEMAAFLEPARRAIGAATTDVIVTAAFVAKQRSKRGRLPVMTYALVPELLANPTAILAQGNRRVLLFLRSGELWSAVVKTTQDGQRNYLLNFRRSNRDDARRLLARDRLVFGDAGELDW